MPGAAREAPTRKLVDFLLLIWCGLVALAPGCLGLCCDRCSGALCCRRNHIILPGFYSCGGSPSMAKSRLIIVVLALTFPRCIHAQSLPIPNCNNPWPSLELFLTIHLKDGSKRNDEFAKFFLRSLIFFWPFKQSQTKLRLVIDEELKNSRSFQIASSIFNSYGARIGPGLTNISFSSPSPYYNDRGYDRQQLLMFWADNFTDSEYIGFVDADCVFTSYVDREDLFEGDKPVVNGRTGLFLKKKDKWFNVPATTLDFTGLEEPMRCMSYFPVIIKTKHLKEIREYISKHHGGKPFNEVFKELSIKAYYSQFNIMCTYLYHFRKDEYRWYVHDTTPGWDGLHPPASRGQMWNKSNYESYMFHPKPRVSAHARYHSLTKQNIVNNPWLLNELLRKGYCSSPPFTKKKNESFCDKYPNDGVYYNNEMHMFDFVDWNEIYNVTLLRQTHIERNARIANCKHEWPLDDPALKVV